MNSRLTADFDAERSPALTCSPTGSRVRAKTARADTGEHLLQHDPCQRVSVSEILIHPFADGNGRTGRALIYTILRRRGEISNYIPPISLVLGSEPKNYVGGLGAYSQGDVGSWCERFAHATTRAASGAEQLAQAIEELQIAWLQRLGEPRKDAAVRQLVSVLPAQPVIDVPAAQRLTGKSHVAVGNAIAQLEQAGILQKLNERKWGRV